MKWIVALLVLLTWAGSAGATTFPRVDALAQQISGNPNEHVECYPPIIDKKTHTQTYGYVEFENGQLKEPGTIHLDGTYCGLLNAAALPKTHRIVAFIVNNDREIGAAGHTLLHELLHDMLASTDEGHVDCQATLNWWQYVRTLKLPAMIAGDIHQSMTLQHKDMAEDFPMYGTEC